MYLAINQVIKYSSSDSEDISDLVLWLATESVVTYDLNNKFLYQLLEKEVKLKNLLT